MDKKYPQRPRKHSLYEPTSAETKKASRLLKRLTPSSSAYREYRILVDAYLNTIAPALRYGQHEFLRGVRLCNSELFSGREFLVAYVDDSWLRKISPELDAAASPLFGQQHHPELHSQLPPFVIIPESKRRARSNAFRSILEHEFVHINQVILSIFPGPPEKLRAEDLLHRFFKEIVAEYEASFVQIVRWPDTFVGHADVSLEQWCLLRGYGPALESALSLPVILDFPVSEVERFFNILSTSLPDGLRRIGVHRDLISWIQPLFYGHLGVAMENVVAAIPVAKEHPAFRAAVYWLHARIEEDKP